MDKVFGPDVAHNEVRCDFDVPAEDGVNRCPNVAVNLVRKTYADTGLPRDMNTCRAHTDKYDRVLLGPGPL